MMVSKGNPVSVDLERELKALRDRPVTRLDPGELSSVVEAVLSSMTGDVSALDIKLYGEIEALSRFIQSARAEIAAVRPDQIRNKDIPLATDELDAVVDATETATNSIMDACDRITNLGGGDLDPAIAEKLQDEVTKIYEACNFQDITGQRITKVVRTLKHIEERVSAILTAFGEELARFAVEDEPAPEPETPAPQTGGRIDDAKLLNGPQMPDEAKRQAEIDAIMASFG